MIFKSNFRMKKGPCSGSVFSCRWQYLHKNPSTRWWFHRSYLDNYLGCWSNPTSFFSLLGTHMAIQYDHFMVPFHILEGFQRPFQGCFFHLCCLPIPYFLEISGFLFPNACWRKNHKRQTFESSPLRKVLADLKAMGKFVRRCSTHPKVAKVPLVCLGRTTWAKHLRQSHTSENHKCSLSWGFFSGSFSNLEVFGEICRITQDKNGEFASQHAALSKTHGKFEWIWEKWCNSFDTGDFCSPTLHLQFDQIAFRTFRANNSAIDIIGLLRNEVIGFLPRNHPSVQILVLISCTKKYGLIIDFSWPCTCKVILQYVPWIFELKVLVSLRQKTVATMVNIPESSCSTGKDAITKHDIIGSPS